MTTEKRQTSGTTESGGESTSKPTTAELIERVQRRIGALQALADLALEIGRIEGIAAGLKTHRHPVPPVEAPMTETFYAVVTKSGHIKPYSIRRGYGDAMNAFLEGKDLTAEEALRRGYRVREVRVEVVADDD